MAALMEGDVRLKKHPSDAVDKVQVLRNFNVSQMKGQKTTTMILRLTSNSKGKDKFWFGDVSAGLANDKGYILIQKYFITPQNQYKLYR
jgi:hypothetical protein